MVSNSLRVRGWGAAYSVPVDGTRPWPSQCGGDIAGPIQKGGAGCAADVVGDRGKRRRASVLFEGGLGACMTSRMVLCFGGHGHASAHAREEGAASGTAYACGIAQETIWRGWGEL